MRLVWSKSEQDITPGGSFGSVAMVAMATTRLTGTIILAQVLLSDHEAQDILSVVVGVREWRNETRRKKGG